MRFLEVLFEPDGVRVKVPAETTVLEAAQQGGIILNSACGGVGSCHKCLVEITGLPQPVRACQFTVRENITVTIPDRSRFFEQKILEEGISQNQGADPLVRKYALRLSPPELTDLRNDARRVLDAVAAQQNPVHTSAEPTEMRFDYGALPDLADTLRRNQYQVTAVCHDSRIIAVEGGDTGGRLFGVAVDIGTTTVVASLMDLKNGITLFTTGQTNPQVAFGDDVVSRIEFAGRQEDGLSILQRKIVDCINGMIRDLCKEAGISERDIYEITAAGNTTMQHILLGIDVRPIAQAPYAAVCSEPVNVIARKLGLAIHPRGNVYVMPGIAGHVGGDTVAVILATAVHHTAETVLAIDIGTNGEIVLAHQGKLFACSTAAGPAFEGAKITHGMRGADGAIERVYLNQGDIEIGVIGGGQAAGICGSGLIDALAELLEAGVMDSTGRLKEPRELPSNIPPAIRRRMIEQDGGQAFLLADASATRHGRDIVLTQRDIRQAQLGKAAIAAGVEMMRRQGGGVLVDRIYLAGAFGNYIRPESARRMGLLPDIVLEKIKFIGNAAGAGARDVLIHQSLRREAERLARQTEYVELAGRPEFMELFSEWMLFPQS